MSNLTVLANTDMTTDTPADDLDDGDIRPKDDDLAMAPEHADLDQDPQGFLEEGEPLKKEGLDPNKGDDEDMEWIELTEDVYSLIYTSRYRSAGLAFCAFVFFFQISLIALVMWDLLDHFDRDKNPLNVPPGVTTQVKVASAFALLLAVATQGDIIAAAVFFQQGYDPGVLERHPSATRFKWFLAGACQFVAGVGFLLTIFVLVMQSNSVIGMMLNFAALSFISEIDEVAFALAKNGFVSDSLEKQVQEVIDFKMPTKRTSKLLRRVVFLTLYAGVMVGYGIITHQQRSGKFLCDSIYVQFGDSFFPAAATFTGIYDQRDKLVNERVTYLERKTKGVLLAYCEDEHAWTLTLCTDFEGNDLGEDPCAWIARSPRTESFDILTTAGSAWLIEFFEGSRSLPLQDFEMVCVDCDEGDDEACNGLGQCVDNNCVCQDDSFGLACVLSAPCSSLAIDARTDSFPPIAAVDFISDEYELLLDDNGKLVTVYQKPVYVFNHEDAYWSVMMFVGRRWIITTSFLIGDLSESANRTQLVESLQSYHGFFSPVSGLYISDPMDVGTPSDKADPVGLQWYRTKSSSGDAIVFNEIDPGQSLNTVLLCTICDFDTNICNLVGNCTDGVCICPEGFNGTLCEVEPPEIIV